MATRQIFLALTTLLFSYVSAQAAEGLAALGEVRGVPTFECIGLYRGYAGDENANSECTMQYRVKGAAAWKQGHPLWADRKRHEYRGSLVHLEPGTTYEIKLSCADPDGGSGTKTLEIATWRERFPEGKITKVEPGQKTVHITESGTPTAYHVVQPAVGRLATVDAASEADNCVLIDADYVIVRNLKLVNAKYNALEVKKNHHDIVIEHCEIVNWGPSGPGRIDYKRSFYGQNKASGIRVLHNCARIVIQHCSIHDPRGWSNSWRKKDDPKYRVHPMGPAAIGFVQTRGNHVIRYNHCYSSEGHYYDDTIGGGNNPKSGNVKCDTDIYGNIASHCRDDALEIEGYNENVRIWGNVLHHALVSIATACVGYNNPKTEDDLYGPMYIWRNICYEGWLAEGIQTGRATKLTGSGPIYYYHNTVSVPGKKKVTTGLSAVGQAKAKEGSPGQALNFTAKNNIFDCGTSVSKSFVIPSSNFMDYNLHLKTPRGRPEWGAHRIVTRELKLVRQGEYSYVLAPGSPGTDAAVRIPNFNDTFSGTAPDMGACEPGAWLMRVGPQGGNR